MNKWRNAEGLIAECEKSPGEGWERVTPAEEVAECLTKINGRMDTLEQHMQDDKQRAADIAEHQEHGDIKPVSLQKICRAIAANDWTGAEYERSVMVPKERTAQATTTDSLGGYVVPPEYLASEFIELIRTEVNFLAAGARMLNVSGGPILIPTQEGGSTTYWVAENTAISESNLTFGQKTAQPHALAALIKTSNRTLRDSSPGIESLIRQDIAENIGIELDRACIYGSGAAGQPLGLTGTTGINTTAAAADITLDLAWAMIDTVEASNALKNYGGVAWLLKHEQWHDLRKAADAAGQPKYSTGAGTPISKECYGIPVFLDGNLTDGDAIFGAFSQFLVMQWGGLEFAASQHADTAFAADQTWIRAIMDVDFVVRQPLSFCFDTSFT